MDGDESRDYVVFKRWQPIIIIYYRVKIFKQIFRKDWNSFKDILRVDWKIGLVDLISSMGRSLRRYASLMHL